MFKKFSWLIYIIITAFFLMSLSGCGGHSSNYPASPDDDSSTTSAQVMSVASPSFIRGETYKIYKNASLVNASGNPQVYIAPVNNPDESKQAALNLGFAENLSGDSVVILDSNDKVVFAYNPKGKGTDTTSTNVTRLNGTQLMYNGLTISTASVSTASLEYDEDEVIDIVLSTTTATEDGATIPSNNYVWHADPDHADEYWTEGISGTTEYDEDEYLSLVTTSTNGIYIARDIRYMTSDLTFTASQTATKDQDTEYVVYYNASSDAVANAVAEYVSGSKSADYGSAYSGPYIFATLPMQNGMGGGGNMGGNPPDGTTPDGGNMGGNPPNQNGGNPPALPGTANVKISATTDSSITAYSTMTHSASDAYNNPVLHITQPGTYRLSGKWHGQIWIDASTASKPKKDSSAIVTIILDGVEVSCDVAPALVFHNVYECDQDENMASFDVGSYVTENAGARVIIADGSTNNFTGANVYRIMKLKPKYTVDDDDDDAIYKVDGTNIGAQSKMYKMDGAFYSFVSMVIGLESGATSGTLNITSTTYEGLDAEMHMTIDSGTINVTAPDDGINVNEDDISVFTMNGGTLTIKSSGGDGIDSNGYVVINSGTLVINAGTQSEVTAGEGGIDSEKGTAISDNASYTHNPVNGATPGDNTNPPSDEGQQPGENPSTDTDTNTITYTDYEIETTYGTTDISFGSSSVFVDDMSSTPRTVSNSDTVFKLETNREVNTFGAITEISQ